VETKLLGVNGANVLLDRNGKVSAVAERLLVEPFQLDARVFHPSYVAYVIDSSNQVVDHSGSQTIEVFPASGRISISTEAATFVRTKAISTTFGIGILGNVTTGISTDRNKERFGGI